MRIVRITRGPTPNAAALSHCGHRRPPFRTGARAAPPPGSTHLHIIFVTCTYMSKIYARTWKVGCTKQLNLEFDQTKAGVTRRVR